MESIGGPLDHAFVGIRYPRVTGDYVRPSTPSCGVQVPWRSTRWLAYQPWSMRSGRLGLKRGGRRRLKRRTFHWLVDLQTAIHRYTAKH